MTLPLETDMPVRATKKNPDKVTVVSSVYYQTDGENPVQVQKAYDRILETTGLQIYQRKVSLSNKWEKVDTGWLTVEDSGVLVVQNLARSMIRYTSNPDDRSKKAESDNTIELSFKGSKNTILIRPNEQQDLEVDDISSLRIRCRSGSLQARISVLPR